MRLPNFTFLLFLTACSASPLAAQANDFNESWRWAHFTTQSGLPSDQVLRVLETRKGVVWVETAGGLAWFDGFQWTAMDTGDGLPPGPILYILGEVRDSLIASDGKDYYIGTQDGFRPLVAGSTIRSVAAEEDEFVFLRASSLYRYCDGVIEPLPPSRTSTQGKVITLARTRSRSLWLNLIDGLYKWENGAPRVMIRTGLIPLGPSVIVENQSNDGALALEFPIDMRGLWEWENGGAPHRNTGEKADNIKAMDISDAGEIIAVYPSDEIRLRRNGVWSPASFNNPIIRGISTITFRHNGDLWVGTQHGLFLYQRSSSRWTFWNYPPPDMRNSVNELLQTSNGDIWVATSDGIEIHTATGGIKEISSVNGVPFYVVTGLAQDREGNVWVSSGASFPGLFRWDGKTWKHFPAGEDKNGVRFHKLRIDHRGRLWALGIGNFYPPIGSTQPGSYFLDRGRFHPWGEREGLINGRVYSFADGSDSTLWFGTFSGISRFRNGKWKHWTEKDGLHGSRVYAMATDLDNSLWFGDYDDRSGLGHIGNDDSLHYFTTADGLVNNNIWDLRCDDDGRLWIATRGGLSSYFHGVWSTFDEKSGLTHLALWPVLPLREQVYVGTRGRGVAILHRGETSTPYPKIVLNIPLRQESNIVLRWKALAYWGELPPGEIPTRIRIDGGQWSPWEKSDEMNLADVPPGTYTYTVQAKGLFGNFDDKGVEGSFVVPLPLHLRPMFLIPVGALALVVVSLGVIMLVRKRNHDLALRKSEEKFRTVTEMTASAIFIYRDERILFVNTTAASVTGYAEDELLTKRMTDIVHPDDRGLIAEKEPSTDESTPRRYECRFVTKSGSVRWMDFTSGWIHFQGLSVRLGTASDMTERKMTEEKLRLLTSEISMTEERERRRMASYLHDVIGQALTLCKLKIRSLQRSTSAETTVKTLQELRELVEQSIANTQSLTFELCPPILYELNLEAAIEWLAEQFSAQHAIEFEVVDDRQQKPVGIESRVILFQAAREVFMNVVKHADAKKVCVSMHRTGSNIRLVVQDDGVGFDVEKKMVTEKPSGGGFGLFNIRERLRSLGGAVNIESSPEHGTTVTISAPLTNGGVAAPRTFGEAKGVVGS